MLQTLLLLIRQLYRLPHFWVYRQHLGSRKRYHSNSPYHRRKASSLCSLLHQSYYPSRFHPFRVFLKLITGVGMFPFRLLQFGPLFVYPFARIGCKTPRDFQELKTPASFRFGMFLPQPILVLILCLSYSVMKPLILIAGLVYFCIGYFVYKYQLLYGTSLISLEGC